MMTVKHPIVIGGIVWLYSAAAFGEGVTEVKVNARHQDAFEAGVSHPIARVPLTIVDTQFGNVTDVKCGKTSQQGIAGCRVVKSDCANDTSDVSYELRLEQYFDGYYLERNMVELEVNQCEFKLPESHSFLYVPENLIVYQNSANSLKIAFTESSTAIGGFDKANPQYVSTIDAFAGFAAKQEPQDVKKLITDSNNLVQYYVKVASSYEKGSEEYKRYQEKATYFERLSVLTANSELALIAQKSLPDSQREKFKVSPSLKDYMSNIKNIAEYQTEILAACASCDKQQIELKLKDLSSRDKLDAKAIKMLKDISSEIRSFD
ncbi:hypothetical protein [Aliikangiella coralliicola]|uniref:Uncharacterized protein n=1 Tax=Aliikangiella coralliicola TaxID=2592383 RepID=A0A545U4M4_9GAMM|nr:hypothetical protein [Aliikangiella coralliicola]TQV84353.1 hypothetical protein FLL46_22270 [Aliikangiella coralliicola]